MEIHKNKSKEEYKKWIEACFQYALEFEGTRKDIQIGDTTVKQVKVGQELLEDELGYTVSMEHLNGDREFFTFLPNGEIDGFYYWDAKNKES